jgi:hypothetical protein
VKRVEEWEAAMRHRSCILAVLFFTTGIFPVFADPPPARPDYVKSLPPDQWVFTEYLWKNKTPCTLQSCMAGYYSDPLMLSVWLEKNSDGPKHTVEIVAAINGCDALGTNLIWESDYEKLPQDKQIRYTTDRVQSLVGSIQKACKTNIPKAVPVGALKALFSTVNRPQY